MRPALKAPAKLRHCSFTTNRDSLHCVPHLLKVSRCCITSCVHLAFWTVLTGVAVSKRHAPLVRYVYTAFTEVENNLPLGIFYSESWIVPICFMLWHVWSMCVIATRKPLNHLNSNPSRVSYFGSSGIAAWFLAMSLIWVGFIINIMVLQSLVGPGSHTWYNKHFPWTKPADAFDPKSVAARVGLSTSNFFSIFILLLAVGGHQAMIIFMVFSDYRFGFKNSELLFVAKLW